MKGAAAVQLFEGFILKPFHLETTRTVQIT